MLDQPSVNDAPERGAHDLLSVRQTRGHASIVRLTRAWYVACASSELKLAPLSRTVLGVPLALFRSEAGAAALLDRCPHRNVALSKGRVNAGELECPYHGWRFDGSGTCTAVPGLLSGLASAPSRCADAYPVVEQDGLVWVWMAPDSTPPSPPYRIPHVDDPNYTVVRLQMTLPGSLLAALENMLDVPHTSFLHGGLFRSAKARNTIVARVARTADGVECEYVGEPRPKGLIGAILAPGGGVVTHFDRFLMPCIGQVEYRLGPKSHILATQAMTPESDYVTRTYAVAAFRLPIPGFLVRPFIEPIVRAILKQDAWVLREQSEAVRRFGGERHTSTDIDLLGPDIWHLLRKAERGEVATPASREIELSV
ncbi:MAG: aromatic ring-hydroxylating dioxygenase subunit alpha [Myxococcales bacterium]|nr:aromatic ring-hydroxylating dioxygenase subunit alpha [Myxococcales bacterium]